MQSKTMNVVNCDVYPFYVRDTIKIHVCALYKWVLMKMEVKCKSRVCFETEQLHEKNAKLWYRFNVVFNASTTTLRRRFLKERSEIFGKLPETVTRGVVQISLDLFDRTDEDNSLTYDCLVLWLEVLESTVSQTWEDAAVVEYLKLSIKQILANPTT